MLTSGNPLTVIALVLTAVKPFPSVAVTVYVVVTVGDAVTVAPVVADSPVAGAHV